MEIRRVLCPVCGPAVEAVPWLRHHARRTNCLADSLCVLAEILAIKHVARLYGLSWHTIKEIHKRHLRAVLEPIDLSRVTRLLIDELAIQKGHQYATVVVDAQREQVLWVGRGRSRESIPPFFELLGDRRTAIEAVAVDMSSAYINELAKQCPNATVIFDHFHIIARYGHEVIDRVRVDAANRYRHDPAQREVIKGSRWLLLRNPESITRNEDRRRLDELVAADHEIATFYIMKDQLNQMWTHSDPVAAPAWYRLTTGALEGMNNGIKVIKRVAYSFRDDEYFLLRIRRAFPENQR